MRKNTKQAQAIQDVVKAVTDATSAAAEDEPTHAPVELGPLFNFGDDSERQHDRTNCYRIEPINEGLLDAIAVDATEEDIRNRWGGGKFKLIAVDADGTIMKNRTIKIAGDPVFDNDIAQQQYTRLLRQKFGISPAGNAPSGAAASDAVEAATEERHRRTLERIAAEAEAKAKIEEQRRRSEREEREAEERRRSDERKAERERDEANRRQEREEREAKEERRWREEREARDREFRERLAADDRRREEEKQEREREREERRQDRAERGDPTAMLVQGMQLAMSMGGGGEPPDAMTAFLSKAPELLQGAKELMATPTRAGNPQQRPAAPPAGKKGPDPIVIDAADPLGKDIYKKAAALGPNGAQAVYQAMRKAVADMATPTPATPPAASAAKPAKVPARPSAKVGKARKR
jgi:hypothetical protein